ncbi:enoyl-CoA delta isomerase 1, peroxisomal-like [Mercurialis annua]|uniref:enoyl-CoA delta isomerase 1, peroxisomal-like n=1 Tax=Mercurialis annua TaxID=3986 RepID=UPI00215F6A64|nr:enoyl-CoA delta isomerase 1, peroxisomal-like [Mercurialis annua]
MCTLEQSGSIYILTLTGSGEHRLNPSLIDSIRSALGELRAKPTSPSSVLITTAHGKFFSNGFDLAWAKTSQQNQLMGTKFQLLVKELISLPMPTIAAVTGHASAAGMILALSHDYIIMRKDKGFLYMSEMDIGLVIPDFFVVLLNCKIGNAMVRREVIMTAVKLTADMAVTRGIVHSAHNSAESTVAAAVRLGEGLVARGWNGDVYGKNRMVFLKEFLDTIKSDNDAAEEEMISTQSKL